MANQKQLALLKRDVASWNQWRQEYPNVKVNLVGADLSRINLSKIDLQNINLRDANFNGSILSGANFSNAQLSNADFRGALLIRANFRWAYLREANFSKANLKEADLRAATLVKADLSEVDLSGANARKADLSIADLSKANLGVVNLGEALLRGAILKGANLRKANLIGANLSEADLSEADLSGCHVYALSAWDVQLENTAQTGLIITRNEPAITVDNLEVAQFIYLILNHKKLRNVLNAVTERGVLLLGRFGGGGLEVLQAVAAKLREENYLPIIFDFERPSDRNYTETVKTLAGLSRFIIADLSGPSVPQELYATVPHFKIPFVPILEAGRKQFAMAPDLLEYPWVVRPPVVFATTEELDTLIASRIIAPAEEKHQARQQLLDELFHDR